MKKTYVKPEVYFESFELSASIADNCGKPLNLNQDTCRDIFGDYRNNVFSQGSCDMNPDQLGFCYHGSVGRVETVRLLTQAHTRKCPARLGRAFFQESDAAR